MADTEDYFPRGGKKPNEQHFKQTSNFLGFAEKGEKKKRKVKKKSEGDDGYLSDEGVKDLEQSHQNYAIGLSYKTVKQGQLMLGRVRYVQETKVNVMLPCRMMGSVIACHISEPYNRILEAYVNDQTEDVRELSQMFRPGQYVAVKVLEAGAAQLMLTMMPQHVNSGRTHADLHNGCLLQAAVSSVEDHGYVMDIGIPHARAFLPKTSANPDVELDTGVLTWCVVKSTSPDPNSVVALSNELAALQAAVQRRPVSGPLMPATAVDFVVQKPLQNGIEGLVFKETTAYVQRHHADTIKGKKPALGQKVRARVLFAMPPRQTPFLTMRDIFASSWPDLEDEQKFQEGDVVDDAQVIKITGRSIQFKLGRGSVGVMSLKRIQVDEDLSDEEVVAKSYPVGSSHKVRVLCYYLSDYTYSVSDQPHLVNERYFDARALRPGQLVEGTVTAAGERVTLQVGRVAGYVPQSHVTDAGVYVDPKKASTSKLTKKKFKVGQEVTARVLSVDLGKQSVYLTLKPSLLAEDLEPLVSYHQAEVGKAYTGVVKTVREYLLVQFFDNVIALVPRNYVTRDPVESLQGAFHPGQIVNCTILRVDPEAKKMMGSLTTTPFWPEKKREKRKQTSDDADNTPSKKRKPNDEPSDIASDKEDKKKGKSSKENNKKQKKNKDKKQQSDDEKKISEESDAIETDIQEDVEVLTPQDLGLIDISDCITAKKCKKRVVSLLKSIKARTRRLETIDKKISGIEERGLNARNKKYHTAMHMEKLVVQERIQKLMEALITAQGKLREFGVEETEHKKKKDKKLEAKKEEVTEDVGSEDKKKVKKSKRKEITVEENLEPVLDVPSAKDFWSLDADSLAKNVEEDQSSSSDEEEKEQPKKKRKKLTIAEKVEKVRSEEERVRQLEALAAEGASQPRSADQFERALLASPDCSQLWIAYMAFHLQATEIEKARAVGRRALSAINFREELERLNVWLAMLNCEHRFGTKESQQKTLEEALQMNDPFKIHSKLLDILVETGKAQELTSLVELMMRKYRRDPQTYVLCGGACYKLGLVEKARQVMQKAIAALEKKEHVSILVQFALLERSVEGGERAEALFEQVLAVYPRRGDVCAVYLDMLAKRGDKERVRQVMERMTSQKLPARKMKALYKKWIEVEERMGDHAQVEAIRQRAMEYIDQAKF